MAIAWPSGVGAESARIADRQEGEERLPERSPRGRGHRVVEHSGRIEFQTDREQSQTRCDARHRAGEDNRKAAPQFVNER
jgi:hypothetical protein